VRFGATTSSRLVLFGGLYFAQGVPWGFVTSALLVRWTGVGLGPAQVSAIGAAALGPWTWKFLLGPLVDALGRRRPLLLACEAVMALTVLALAAVDPRRDLGLFLALVFVSSSFVALQDVLTDAVALAILPEAERGRANGVMSAAKYAGTVVGASGLIFVAGKTGWAACHGLAAALLLLPAGTVLGLDEPPRVRATAGAVVELLRQVLRSFGRRATLVAALFVLLAGASDRLLAPFMVATLRQRLGLTDDQMALLGTLGAPTTMAGALAGGWVADRLGRRRAIVAAAVALAAAHLAFGVATPSMTTLMAYQIGNGLAGGMLYATTIALCMDLTSPRVAATHFQAFMALFSVRSIWAGLAGGQLAQRLPGPALFLVAALIELLPLALLPFLSRPGEALSSGREAQGRRLR